MKFSKKILYTVLLILAALLSNAAFNPGVFAMTPHQSDVMKKGSHVMPFDLEQTLHIFQKTDYGGLQDVIARDPSNTAQIKLIREHLQDIAAKFQKGDFSGPAEIHGSSMPGLAEIRAGVSRINIRYSPLPNGGRIKYSTDDPELVNAIHRWFSAQVADHGKYATDHY